MRKTQKPLVGRFKTATIACAVILLIGCQFKDEAYKDWDATFAKHEVETDPRYREAVDDAMSSPLPELHYGPSEVSVLQPSFATQLFEFRGKPVDLRPIIEANLSSNGIITQLDPYRFSVTDKSAAMNIISDVLTKMGCRVESTSPGSGVRTHVFVEPSMGKALTLAQSLLGASGRLNQAPGGWLSITDSIENLDRISAVLQDAGFRPGEIVRQKDLSMNVYTCRHREPSELMSAIKPHLSSAGRIQLLPPDKLVICDGAARIKMLHQILGEIDTLLPQVVIESTIYEIFADVTADYSSYVIWREEVKGIDTVFSIEQELLSSRSTAAGAVGTLLKASREGEGTLKMGEIESYLDFLVSEGKARVLTQPWVTATSGQKASISTGDEIPYRAYQVASGTESFVTEYQTAEIKLEVTPRVLSGGLIQMHVAPEADTLSGYRGAEQLPVISKRMAETDVIVASNDTYVIGGLRKEEKRSVNRGLPVLRHIPVLGLLFRSNDLEENQTELYIAITPKIVMPKTQEQVRAEAAENARRQKNTSSRIPPPYPAPEDMRR